MLLYHFCSRTACCCSAQAVEARTCSSSWPTSGWWRASGPTRSFRRMFGLRRRPRCSPGSNDSSSSSTARASRATPRWRRCCRATSSTGRGQRSRWRAPAATRGPPVRRGGGPGARPPRAGGRRRAAVRPCWRRATWRGVDAALDVFKRRYAGPWWEDSGRRRAQMPQGPRRARSGGRAPRRRRAAPSSILRLLSAIVVAVEVVGRYSSSSTTVPRLRVWSNEATRLRCGPGGDRRRGGLTVEWTILESGSSKTSRRPGVAQRDEDVDFGLGRHQSLEREAAPPPESSEIVGAAHGGAGTVRTAQSRGSRPRRSASPAPCPWPPGCLLEERQGSAAWRGASRGRRPTWGWR